ncbi:MAG: MerR family transcriptional regulator [Actinomycetota bacterium]|nr:MerR family transcriptional regulator [Actinomycetota bacterium]
MNRVKAGTREDPLSGSDVTIDQLAAQVGMTVRNVRAYASRGLIPPPRLVGRTGYYGEEHATRLRLIRDLIDRGYTLAAVERAVLHNASLPAGHALALLNVLDNPLGRQEEPEEVTRDALAASAGVRPDDDMVDALVRAGLVERVDDETLRLLRPSIVHAGTQAVALGLSRESVLAMLPLLAEHLRPVAQRFVDEFREQIWHPFAEAGMPEEEWPEVLQRIKAVLPVAGQSVLAVFRDQLTAVIDEALGEELQALADGAQDSA